MGSLKTVSMDAVRVHGRTSNRGIGINLFWTGSAVEMNCKASTLQVVWNAGFEFQEQWITILINGAFISRVMLQKGRNELTVFRNMNPDKVKNVRIIKDVQAMSDDVNHYLQLAEVRTDGDLLPVAERPHKLAFIGDSITSGEGTYGATQEEDWIAMFFSGHENYTYMVAEQMNADYQVVSQSGWGLYCGWDNDVRHSLLPYYDQVCGLLRGEETDALGAKDPYDFRAFQPEAVILHLGTNDASAFSQPAFTDPDTGITYKQALLPDGTLEAASKERFQKQANAFLKHLREVYPNAYIIWTYGMLGDMLLQTMEETTEAYQKETGDEKCMVLALPNTTDETVGSRCHPGVLAHQKAADVIVKKLKELL